MIGLFIALKLVAVPILLVLGLGTNVNPLDHPVASWMMATALGIVGAWAGAKFLPAGETPPVIDVEIVLAKYSPPVDGHEIVGRKPKTVVC